MRPIHRFLLPALIICLIFGTVPTAFADEPADIAFIEDVAKATLVTCGDPTKEYTLDPDPNDPLKLAVHYYSISLDSGQLLTVDVDSDLAVNGVVFDYILQLFDINGTSLADSDDAPAPGESIGLDPYLQFTAIEYGTYIIAVSTWDALYSTSYEITFECTDVEPVSELQPGDLLASTGPSDGSLISIDRETGTTGFRGTLGEYGQVVDIEFRDDDVLFGAAVDEVGTIITIDPNTGVETKVGSLEAGYVTALEFGGDPVSLYGIYQISEDANSQLGTINQGTGAFTVVGVSGAIDGYNKVGALAYDSLAGTMYGVGTSLDSEGIDLMTIDLATGAATEVGPTGITSQILALEFGPDGKLYGVTAPSRSDDDDTFFITLVTIDTVDGTATEVVEVGGNAAEAVALAVVRPTSMVSGLAFKPGWEPQPDSTIITSRDDNPFVGRLIDKFKFEGVQGESVKIIVDLLEKETKDELSPEVIETTSKWSKWSKKKFLVEGEFRGHAYFSLRDAMSDLYFRERVRGPMPLTIEAVLPAKGLYYLILMQPVPRSLRVDYSLTMTSSEDAFKTLEATRLFERRKCTDGEDNGTTDNPEQNAAVSTLQATSLSSTGESTPITPAADGGSEDGQTVDNTTNTTDDPGDIDEDDSEDTQGDDDNSAGADGETTDEVVVETPAVTDPDGLGVR